jgi:DNA-directed RNA polymerase subunit RPC12/RpoP
MINNERSPGVITHPEASAAAKQAGSPARSVRPDSRKRQPAPIAPASIIAPFRRRRGWTYTYPCGTCGANLVGWAKTLDAIPGERRAGCGHRVQVMAVMIHNQPEQPQQGAAA